MDLSLMSAISWNHVDQITKLYNTPLTGDQIKTKFDIRANEVRTALNLLITQIATRANIDYYVDPLGSDSNDGLSNVTAFLTVAKAISMIPQIVNHVINVYIAAGTYAETVTVDGFMGYGSINFICGGDVITAANYSFTAFRIRYNTAIVTLYSLKTTGSLAILVFASRNVSVSYCTSVNSSASGVAAGANSSVFVKGCLFNNKTNALSATDRSTIYSENNDGSGTGNTRGLNAAASTIYKSGTQPFGTELESAGGQIL